MLFILKYLIKHIPGFTENEKSNSNNGFHHSGQIRVNTCRNEFILIDILRSIRYFNIQFFQLFG